MTRYTTLVLLGLCAAFSLAAETVRQPEFRVRSPEIMGQGRSYVAVAEGYEALFSNPAGIAETRLPQWTAPSLTTWVYSRPDLLLSTIGALGGDDVQTAADDPDTTRDDLIIDALTEQFTTNGFGVGSAIGFGYVGNRIGLGLRLGVNSYLYGDTFPLGLEGEIDSQFTAVVGYAQPFQIGPVRLTLGGALRPTLRISSFVDSDVAADLIEQFIGIETGDDGDGNQDLTESIRALNGWGVAFDLGTRVQYRSFAVAAQLRNAFNTTMEYSNNTLAEIQDALSAGGLPRQTNDSADPAYVEDSYVIPAELSIGAAWQPDLGLWSSIVDPELHFQITDPFGRTDPDRNVPRSFWTRMHVGSEIRLLNFFDLRFGVNQGYFTLGTGLSLVFLDINFALYNEEFGRYPGDQPVGGAALEFAFRF